MNDLIACYVSGKGMYASHATWTFKTIVMELLESTQLGYDTRYRFYRNQYPSMPSNEFARMVCDPIEGYDKDWPTWQAEHTQKYKNKDELVTAFFLERDRRFQRDAQVAIYGFDEAGFGSGINAMRFINAGKPILGFYNPSFRSKHNNIHNVIQLQLEHPNLVTLHQYIDAGEFTTKISSWLKNFKKHHKK